MVSAAAVTDTHAPDTHAPDTEHFILKDHKSD